MAQSAFANVDDANDEVTLRILERVASAKDQHETDLSPLYSAVDPDALATLLHRSEADLRVAFRFEGRRVTVRESGEVTVDVD